MARAKGALVYGQSSEGSNDLRAAAAAEQAGRYEEAATLYRRFLSGTESSQTANPSILVQVRTRLATDYFLLHRYRESLNAIRSLTSKNSDGAGLHAQAWLVDALDRLELGQIPQAIASFRRTLALNPNSGTARLALGDALERSGHLEDAAQEYEEQAQRTPDVPDAWYKLGLAYRRLAAQISEEFARRFPTSALGQQLKAENHLAMGNDMDAAGILLPLIRKEPDQPQIHGDLGAALIDLGFPKSAEQQFRQELSQNPDSPLATLGLAETEALRSDWENAVADLERIARSQPHELTRLLESPPPGPLSQAWVEGRIPLPERLAGSPGGVLWNAWLTNSDSRPIPAGGRQPCNDSSTKAMSTPGIWVPEACYEQLRNRLARRKALSSEERIKLAEAEFRLGDHRAAREETRRLLQSDVRNAWGLYWLGRSNGILAEDCFSKIASLSPESARVHEILGGYYNDRHNFTQAKTEYLAAIRLAPNLPDLHLGLAEACWLSGDLPTAEKEFQRTLELAPGSKVGEYELGDTLLKEGRVRPAVDHLLRALGDPTLAVRVRLDLSRAAAEQGETRQALDELLKVQTADKDGQIHYRLAGLYRKLGDKPHAKEAIDVFRRLRANTIEVDRSSVEALERHQETLEHTRAGGPPQ